MKFPSTGLPLVLGLLHLVPLHHGSQCRDLLVAPTKLFLCGGAGGLGGVDEDVNKNNSLIDKKNHLTRQASPTVCMK